MCGAQALNEETFYNMRDKRKNLKTHKIEIYEFLTGYKKEYQF